MEFLKIIFPVSGIETYLFLPPLVAFVISFFTSMAGISGAFLILPFQMSVLGFTTPSVSSTNLLYNVVGTPGGITRYIREGRMVWPLTGCITSGTLPGVLAGYYLRVKYLPDPRAFKFFVGLVLLYIGFRLLKSIPHKRADYGRRIEGGFKISNVSYGLKRIEYDFAGERISFSAPALLLFSLLVGVIGGIYGIGGGALIVPFCVSVLRMPVYTVAGAALTGTFVTSLAGILFYSTIPLNNGLTAPPDWLLGILFGVGGFLGMALGATAQRHVPEKMLKAVLAAVILIISGRYIVQFIL